MISEFIRNLITVNPLNIKNLKDSTIEEAFFAISLSTIDKPGLENVLLHIPEELHSEHLFLFAVNTNPKMIRFVPEKFLSTELCKSFICRYGSLIAFIPKKYQTNELCVMAIKPESNLIKFKSHFLIEISHGYFNNYKLNESDYIKAFENGYGVHDIDLINKKCLTKEVVFTFLRYHGKLAYHKILISKIYKKFNFNFRKEFKKLQDIKDPFDLINEYKTNITPYNVIKLS